MTNDESNSLEDLYEFLDETQQELQDVGTNTNVTSSDFPTFEQLLKGEAEVVAAKSLLTKPLLSDN